MNLPVCVVAALAHGLMTCAILLFSPPVLTQRDDVATRGLCVLCAVNQNHSSSASATVSSTVNLCPSVESLAKSGSFSLGRDV